MTKGNSTSVVAIRLPDAVVARIKTIARRRRKTVNELLKKVILGHVAGEYYSEEQVAELCEKEPLAWEKTPQIEDMIIKVEQEDIQTIIKQDADNPVTNFSKVGRNALCPCGSGKKFKKCHGR